MLVIQYKIPELQNQYAKLKDEVERIDERKVMSKHELDKMNNHIIYIRSIMYQLSIDCNNKRNEIAYLQIGVQVLEGQINRLNNNDNQEQEIEMKV
jgi:chromosome segregation ATPase